MQFFFLHWLQMTTMQLNFMTYFVTGSMVRFMKSNKIENNIDADFFLKDEKLVFKYS